MQESYWKGYILTYSAQATNTYMKYVKEVGMCFFFFLPLCLGCTQPVRQSQTGFFSAEPAERSYANAKTAKASQK